MSSAIVPCVNMGKPNLLDVKAKRSETAAVTFDGPFPRPARTLWSSTPATELV